MLSIILVVLLGANTSCSTGPGAPAVSADPSLDELFARLQAAETLEEGRTIGVAIRETWWDSGDRDIDALMGEGVAAMYEGDLDLALAIFNRVVEEAPDYPEGWNLRATVHYLRDDYGQAIADIHRVLSIEPRHFGAMAGLGQILLEIGDQEAALFAFESALAVNPHLPEVRHEVRELREQLAGIPI